MSDDNTQHNTLDTPITFIASIAPLQTAISISGDGNGIRLKLDIPESHLLPFLHMLAMRQTAFRVTIEADDNGTQKAQKTTY